MNFLDFVLNYESVQELPESVYKLGHCMRLLVQNIEQDSDIQRYKSPHVGHLQWPA